MAEDMKETFDNPEGMDALSATGLIMTPRTSNGSEKLSFLI